MPSRTNIKLEHEVGLYYLPASSFTYSVENGVRKYAFDVGRAVIPLLANLAGFRDNIGQYKLGNIIDFEREQQRTFIPKHSLGDYAFQPEAFIPQKIETTLTIKKAVLKRSGEFLKVFGFVGGNLFNQTQPVTVIEFFEYRDVAEGLGGAVEKLLYSNAVMYEGCWVTTNPIKYDTADQETAVIQGIKLNVTRTMGLDFGAMVNSAVPKVIGGLAGRGIEAIVGAVKSLIPGAVPVAPGVPRGPAPGRPRLPMAGR